MGSDVTKLVDTMMSIPGMSEKVKNAANLSRRSVLVLSAIIAKGLTGAQEATGLLDNLPEEVSKELITFADDYLDKAGLVEFNQKLKSLTGK